MDATGIRCCTEILTLRGRAAADRLDSGRRSSYMEISEIVISRISTLCLVLCLVSIAPLSAQSPELNDIDELKAQFNRDAGIPRIVLLMSPT